MKTSSKGRINGAKKGKQFERDVANAIAHIFPDAQRRLEYQSSQVNGADLDNTGPYRIQCKRNQGYAPISKIKEVDREEGFIPVLVTKGNKMAAMVVMYFTDWIQQLELIHGRSHAEQIGVREVANETRQLDSIVEAAILDAQDTKKLLGYDDDYDVIVETRKKDIDSFI